jgi:hypothetical protein
MTVKHYLILLMVSPLIQAAEWHVSTSGDDANPGDRRRPFATLQRAERQVEPGDTVFIHGGTFRMQDKDIARRRGIWAYVIDLQKCGEPGKPIRYRAMPGSRPVFDFSAVKPAGLRIHAFEVGGSHRVIEGISVTGVQVTIQGHTQSICFSNRGSHNRFENLRMHDGMGIGFYLDRGSHNRIVNCDAWNNHDPVSEGGRGGNVDGFGGHPGHGDVGNIFRGCRAWFNSDDGFDCISAWEAIRYENCVAYGNGRSPEGRSLGDGNGFKIGGFGLVAERGLPDPLPRHTVIGCIAAGNKANGFYANHHPGGSDWIHNTAFANRTNFNFLGRDFTNRSAVSGTGHRIRYNLSVKAQRAEVEHLDPAKCELTGNVFGGELSVGDFITCDKSALVAPRRADGRLPEHDFMIPKPGSQVAGLRPVPGFSGVPGNP